MNHGKNIRARKVWKVLLYGAVLLSVTACSAESTKTRQVVEESGQKLRSWIIPANRSTPS